MQAFTTGAAAGQKIFSTIDRVSPLDPETTDGLKPKEIIGEIELMNIKHIYPSRPEVVVMEDVSLMIPAGKTTALVGSSGSGKSTIVGLVERFYDPVGGNVYLDGVNVRDINLHYLRQNVALVSQEPTLFGTTIRGNIGHGLIGTSHENATNEEREILIIEAAKMANAHDFISALPEGYDTNVGERGFLLSGGQKQRIAIARAVVSDPKILLLDEATSALDTKSEGVVQAALDRAAEGRTTIVIAHRLSTIRNSHNIVVMSAGRIVEQGTHDNLLGMKGTYYGLVEAQQLAAATKQKEVEEEAEDLMLDPRSGMQRMPTEKDLKLGLTRTTTNKSVSSKVLKDNSAPVEADYSLWELIRIIAGFNKTDKLAMGIGLFASIIAGAGQPVQAVLFAKCIVALSRPPSQYAQLRSDINFWSGMFFMLAWAQFISYSVQGVAFAFCSERLIHRARDRAFRTFLRQDIGYFDYEENSSGALTSFLSTQTTHAAGLSGSTLGTILNVLTTLIGGFILALALGWKLSLVCISTVPILLACGYFRFSLLAKFEARSKKAYEKSASYACESTNAIRTVASLTREQDVWEHYHLQLVAQGARSLKSILYSSFLYAASQSFIFLCIALGFWYGGTLIGSREYDEQTFFIVFSAVVSVLHCSTISPIC
jgi:ATP-binding cassette subfamily B (MDR/TAP) protein 1